jgi:SHS2 domain-containing protein
VTATTALLPFHERRDHTSEVELHLRAGSLGDLLAEAGRALAEVELIGADCVLGVPVRTIRVSSSDRDALLVDWLNELIFLADIDRWVAMDFSIDLVKNTEVRARASGVTLEWGLSRVKAATFHGLRVEDIPGGLEARVILDV